MKVVTLLRKPLEGTATQNVLAHGCGALNINGCRIAGPAWKWGTQTDIRGGNFNSNRPSEGHVWAKNIEGHSSGRWPANLILQHKPGCKQTGTTTVAGYTINRWTDGAKPFGGGAGHEYKSEQQPDEQIAVWKCMGGCAVQALGEQSGEGDTGTASRYFKQVKP